MSTANEKNLAMPNEKNPARPIQPNVITEEKKMLLLRTCDEQEFKVEQSIAIQSITIKNCIDDVGCDSKVIPLPNVHSKTLTKVIEYLEGQANPEASEEDLNDFDKSFTKSFSNMENVRDVSDLVEAANYLNIRGLFNVLCQLIADTIKNKSLEEIREFFNIDNNFTEEEQAVIQNEHDWAFG